VTWFQTYFVFGQGLGVSALIAAIPVFTLLFLLGVMRKPAWMTGLVGLGVTLAIAIFAYRMPVRAAVSAAGLGAAFGIFPITWIIFGALALFRVSVESGQFEGIRKSIARLTPEPRLQALLIAFAFGAFMEGAAGFGAPVAIASTMLAGLGFSAFDASAACLLTNTAPVAFGSIGIPIVTLAGTTGLSFARLSADVGLLSTPFALILPAYLIVVMWGFRGLRGVWLPTLTAGVVYAAVQFVVSNYLGAQLTNILASITCMSALVLLLRFGAARKDSRVAAGQVTGEWIGAECEPGGELQPQRSGALLYAWLPYMLLVACVLLWGWAPVRRTLNMATAVVSWPFLDHIVWRLPPVVSAPSPYPATFTLNWLTAAGTSCMVATVLAALCVKMNPVRFLRILVAVARQLYLPTVTVASVLAVAFLMNYCGATATLGLAFAATGKLFPFFGALLGWLGVFLTGSDTASNALFGNLQVVTAGRLGLDPVLMAATNSVGGVMGKMISLQTIAVAAAATGISVADQARLFRLTLKHSLLLVALVGVFAMLLAYGRL
jgi:L-lactate transport